MNSTHLFTAAAVALASFTGCTFVFLPDTTIVAQNDLTDLQVSVGGSSNIVTGVDLSGVTIGDAYFSYIAAGEVTEAETTETSGTVDIEISSAVANVKTLILGSWSNASRTITGIDVMETDIASGEENTIIFDETTAGVVFNAIAKKMAK